MTDNPIAAIEANADPMSMLDSLDLSTVQTGMPLIPEQLVELEVIKLEVKDSKNDSAKKNLHISLATTQPMTSVEGKALNPGFPVFDLVSLTMTDKYDFRTRLAEFREATVGKVPGPFNPVEQYIGCKVMVRMKIERSEEFGNRNRVGRYIKKG